MNQQFHAWILLFSFWRFSDQIWSYFVKTHSKFKYLFLVWNYHLALFLLSPIGWYSRVTMSHIPSITYTFFSPQSFAWCFWVHIWQWLHFIYKCPSKYNVPHFVDVLNSNRPLVLFFPPASVHVWLTCYLHSFFCFFVPSYKIYLRVDE